MPWYKFAAVHRSGHTTVEYLWFQERLEDRKAEWIAWTGRHGFSDVLGHAAMVRHLPESVRQQKLTEWRKRLAEAREMLGVLWQTPVRRLRTKGGKP